MQCDGCLRVMDATLACVQVLSLVLFAVKVGRERGVLSEAKATEVLSALQKIPEQIACVTHV